MEMTQQKQESITAQQSPKSQTPIPKKKRKWVKRVIIAAVVVGLVGGYFLLGRGGGKQGGGLGYIPAVATARDITVGVSDTGTVQPIDSYKVTALVKGEVLEAPFEEGDTVGKDDLLFRIDSKDVENSIRRSEIGLQQSRLSYEDLVKNKSDNSKNTALKATAAGVVTKLHYEEGDMVAAGTAVAELLDRTHMRLTVPFHTADAQGFSVGQAATVQVAGETLSGTVHSVAATDTVGLGGTLVRQVEIQVSNPGALSHTDTGTATVGAADCAESGPFAYAAEKTVLAKTSGTLEKLYVKEGDAVSDGQLLGAFEGADLDTQIENSRLSLQSAELALQSTRDQLDNYTVTSPISGTVIEKNYKVGDNVDPTAAATTGYMAVIYDMSTLTFEMKIDELDINKVKVGQVVEITAAALEGQSFTGRVDKININGSTVGSATSYPVTVVIDDPKDLLPGMNVSANIVVERAKSILTIPVEAVSRGNEVTVALPGAMNAEGTAVVDPAKLETRTVTLGRNDSANVEIESGLSEGEVVVYKNAVVNPFAMMMGG